MSQVLAWHQRLILLQRVVSSRSIKAGVPPQLNFWYLASPFLYFCFRNSGHLYNLFTYDFWFTVHLRIVCGGRFQFDSFASCPTMQVWWHEKNDSIKNHAVRASYSRYYLSITCCSTLFSSKITRYQNQKLKSWLSIDNCTRLWNINYVIFTYRNVWAQDRTFGEDWWQFENIYSDIPTCSNWKMQCCYKSNRPSLSVFCSLTNIIASYILSDKTRKGLTFKLVS